MFDYKLYSERACPDPRQRQRHARPSPAPGSRFWLAAAALSLGALAGCGAPSVKDVCKELEERGCDVWSRYLECVTDGNALRERVEERGGCDGAFDDYLSCIGDLESCGWQSCAAELDRVDTCVGGL